MVRTADSQVGNRDHVTDNKRQSGGRKTTQLRRARTKASPVKETSVQRIVQQNVQEQLTERGEFSPIEMLISIGRLLYADYEDWRRGKVKTLDKLFINLSVVKSLLQEAAAYSSEIGLQCKTIEWTPWIDRSVDPLKISQYSDLCELLSCRYVPLRHQLQLDLFYDNGVVSDESRVLAAFVDGSLDDVERSIADLYRTNPSHPDMGLYEHLQRYMKHCRTRRCEANNLHKEFQVLSDKIVPLAHAALKSRARDFLSPHWGRLIECCKPLPYRDRPQEVSLSRLYWEMADWQQVIEACKEELSEQVTLEVLVRAALAFDRLSRLGSSYQAWFLICWLYPEMFVELIVEQPDVKLQALWVAFCDVDVGEDEEGIPIEGLPVSHFPAFCLIYQPLLSIQVPEILFPGIHFQLECESARQLYYVAHQLCQIDGVTNSDMARDHAERSIELRKTLSNLSPILMKLYLETHFS